MTGASSVGFKSVNLIVDTKKIPLLDKINLHMQTGQLIVNYLKRTSSIVVKVENMLGKVIK